jgi:hypothetical protein
VERHTHYTLVTHCSASTASSSLPYQAQSTPPCPSTHPTTPCAHRRTWCGIPGERRVCISRPVAGSLCSLLLICCPLAVGLGSQVALSPAGLIRPPPCPSPLSRPQRPDAAVIVAAESDAYVSTDSVRQLHAYWEGSELRLVSGGHVSAFLLHQPTFRQAVLDSLQRLGKL